LPIEWARCRCLLSYFSWVSDEIEGHWKTNDSRCLHCVKQTRRDPREIASRKSYYVSLFNPSCLAELQCLVLRVTINLLEAYNSNLVCSIEQTDLRLSDHESTAFDPFVTENGYTWTRAVTSKSNSTWRNRASRRVPRYHSNFYAHLPHSAIPVT
jgi:hypothetical protein